MAIRAPEADSPLEWVYGDTIVVGRRNPGRFCSSEKTPGAARKPTTATISRAISSWSTKRTASRSRTPASAPRAIPHTMVRPTPSSNTLPAVGSGATEYRTDAAATSTYTVSAPRPTIPRVRPAWRILLETIGAISTRARMSNAPRSIVSSTSGLARTSSAPDRTALLCVPRSTSTMARCCLLILTRPVRMKAPHPPGDTAMTVIPQMTTAHVNPTNAIPPVGGENSSVRCDLSGSPDRGKRGDSGYTSGWWGTRGGRSNLGRWHENARRIRRARRPGWRREDHGGA